MRIVTTNPPNTGVDLVDLNGDLLDLDRVYVRCNFAVPVSPPQACEVVLPGKSPRLLTLEDLDVFEKVEREVVLECAGNGRSLMEPVPEGTQWDLDAVSPIRISGFRLADVLGGLPDDVVDVVFTGADSGVVEPEGQIPYQFSIGRELAMSTVPLLVTHIGGAPLDLLHGAPMRLVVPGHYAMASVKWLARVEATTEPFEGHFVKKYRYYSDDFEPEQTPVEEIAVRSVVAVPAHGESVDAGQLVISGSAWAASSPVDKVEVSLDGGVTWDLAELTPSAESPWSVVRWSLTVEVLPGILDIVARASDTSGVTQPLQSRWNANGYANNVVHRVTVTVL